MKRLAFLVITGLLLLCIIASCKEDTEEPVISDNSHLVISSYSNVILPKLSYECYAHIDETDSFCMADWKLEIPQKDGSTHVLYQSSQTCETFIIPAKEIELQLAQREWLQSQTGVIKGTITATRKVNGLLQKAQKEIELALQPTLESTVTLLPESREAIVTFQTKYADRIMLKYFRANNSDTIIYQPDIEQQSYTIKDIDLAELHKFILIAGNSYVSTESEVKYVGDKTQEVFFAQVLPAVFSPLKNYTFPSTYHDGSPANITWKLEGQRANGDYELFKSQANVTSISLEGKEVEKVTRNDTLWQYVETGEIKGRLTITSSIGITKTFNINIGCKPLIVDFKLDNVTQKGNEPYETEYTAFFSYHITGYINRIEFNFSAYYGENLCISTTARSYSYTFADYDAIPYGAQMWLTVSNAYGSTESKVITLDSKGNETDPSDYDSE